MKTVISIRSVQKTVHNSAKLLDSERPDWYRSIDVDSLNMNSHSNCICGQLGGMHQNMSMNESRGFNIDSWEKEIDKPGRVQAEKFEYSVTSAPITSKVLTRLWKFQIAKRRRCDEKKAIDAMFRC